MTTLFCLMGPTATGKTTLAIKLASLFPFELISVDSVMVYKNMTIGSAKPDMIKHPHYLIDRYNPDHRYSAGEFCKNITDIIPHILKKNKIPLLVGGTMLYFRALQQGLSELPPADAHIREKIKLLENPYQTLHNIDPVTAQKLHPNDTQRIERALEVYEITQIPLSVLHQKNNIKINYNYINLGLVPDNILLLKNIIQTRFMTMLDQGFIQEVESLWPYKNTPALKSVGYKQILEYLDNKYDKATMIQKAVTATQQLAKRQLTWLRTWPNLHRFDPYSPNIFTDLSHFVQKCISEAQTPQNP